MEVLKLLEKSSVLRRMFYAVLAVVLVYGVVRAPVLVELVKALLPPSTY